MRVIFSLLIGSFIQLSCMEQSKIGTSLSGNSISSQFQLSTAQNVYEFEAGEELKISINSEGADSEVTYELTGDTNEMMEILKEGDQTSLVVRSTEDMEDDLYRVKVKATHKGFITELDLAISLVAKPLVINPSDRFEIENLDQLVNPENADKVAVISSDLDLEGRTLELPANLILEPGGGILTNGTLRGNYLIATQRAPLFDDSIVLRGRYSRREFFPEWFDSENAIGKALSNSTIVSLQANKVYRVRERVDVIRDDNSEVTGITIRGNNARIEAETPMNLLMDLGSPRRSTYTISNLNISGVNLGQGVFLGTLVYVGWDVNLTMDNVRFSNLNDRIALNYEGAVLRLSNTDFRNIQYTKSDPITDNVSAPIVLGRNHQGTDFMNVSISACEFDNISTNNNNISVAGIMLSTDGLLFNLNHRISITNNLFRRIVGSRESAGVVLGFGDDAGNYAVTISGNRYIENFPSSINLSGSTTGSTYSINNNAITPYASAQYRTLAATYNVFVSTTQSIVKATGASIGFTGNGISGQTRTQVTRTTNGNANSLVLRGDL